MQLTGEQHNVLTLPPQGPVLIRGAAGSGKTTVAILRAQHLQRTYADLFQAASVGIFSYANSLVSFIRSVLGKSRVGVSTLHAYAFRLVEHYRARPQVAEFRALHDALDAGLAAARHAAGADADRAVLDKSRDFYKDEIAWIKGRRIATLEQYAATRRSGRGTADRVTAEDRPHLWRVFEGYNAHLGAQGLRDFDDLVLDALAIVETPDYRPPFTHIVVDEAQDHTFAQLCLVARLIQPGTNSITLVADAAQRIYQSGFSWNDTGIRIAGARSVEFRRNYRNTRAIAAAAASLLAKEEDRSEFTECTLPERDGPKPCLLGLRGRDFAAWLTAWLAGIPAEQTAALAVPTHAQLKALRALLASLGVNPLPLNPRNAESRPVLASPGARRVHADTLHNLKGLQFDHVLLSGLNAGVFPHPDAGADPEGLSRIRKLLYVAMTRACRTLTLHSDAQPSRLLGEIDPALFESAASI